MKSKWIKASDKMPKLGRLIVIKRPLKTKDGKIMLEYDAGIVMKGFLELWVGRTSINENSEWQYLEE